MKKILVLGAGLVAGPAVRYLLDQSQVKVHLADQEVAMRDSLERFGFTNG